MSLVDSKMLHFAFDGDVLVVIFVSIIHANGTNDGRLHLDSFGIESNVLKHTSRAGIPLRLTH